jgi:hypothetical protein
MSVAELSPDFGLKLKKIFSSDAPKYELKLCCPQIVELTNDCPRRMIAVKFPPCFVNDGTYYTVNFEGIKLTYTNMTSGDSKDAVVVKSGKCAFALILTDDVLKVNDLCITEVCVPVVPSCLDANLINTDVSILTVTSFECYESDLRRALKEVLEATNGGLDESTITQANVSAVSDALDNANNCGCPEERAITEQYLDAIVGLYTGDPMTLDEILNAVVVPLDEAAAITKVLDCVTDDVAP